MINELTGLILTYNETPNIGRTLHHLTWLKRIIVIDSYSTDETLSILRAYPQVEIYQRSFDSFAQQCNYGLQQITSDWVLSLDADYILTNDLIDELKALPVETPVNGYYARFKYCVYGKALRGTLYPPRQVLYRRSQACYADDGHGHRVQVQGQTATLNGYIHHDDRKPLKCWLGAQDRYMVTEAQKLLDTPTKELNLADRLRRRKIIAPFVVLFYCLIINKVILDGWPGWYYAFQRMLAEMLLSIRLIEAEKLQQEPAPVETAGVKTKPGLTETT